MFAVILVDSILSSSDFCGSRSEVFSISDLGGSLSGSSFDRSSCMSIIGSSFSFSSSFFIYISFFISMRISSFSDSLDSSSVSKSGWIIGWLCW